MLQVNHIMLDQFLHNVARRAATSPDTYAFIRDVAYHDFRREVNKKRAAAEKVEYLRSYCGFLLEHTIADWLWKQGCSWKM